MARSPNPRFIQGCRAALIQRIDTILGKIDAFGNGQWAFRKKRNYRDLVTLLVASWIMAVHIGNKIGTYLSDIAAAFDRVFKHCMLAKCRRAGASDCFLAFLSDLLAPRRASVIVDGVSSDPFTV